MSNHKSLVFFNKEGDYLNVKYNNAVDRFEGDLLFHQSASDIYKTIGLYTMEYLPAFEYSSVLAPCQTIYPIVADSFAWGFSAGATVSLGEDYGTYNDFLEFQGSFRSFKDAIAAAIRDNSTDSYFSTNLIIEDLPCGRLFRLGDYPDYYFLERESGPTDLYYPYILPPYNDPNNYVMAKSDSLEMRKLIKDWIDTYNSGILSSSLGNTYLMKNNIEASDKDLTLSKFQIFNEWGTHFYGARLGSFMMESIEPVNNDPAFYSKWVYGTDFERIFPIGTFIMFESEFLEFQDTKKTYAVIGSKKGAVMIISDVDNATFESMYYTEYTNEGIVGVTLRGSNLLGIYNYIGSDYKNNLSEWNEQNFYERYYAGKKLNVVNSSKNDGVYTVKESEIADAVHFEYYTKSVPTDKTLVIELMSRTDVPKIYDGGISISSGRVNFKSPSRFPKILKPGREFKIVGSSINSNFLTVSYIPRFASISELVVYSEKDQVLYNNNIYQCIKAYTQDYSSDLTKGITPAGSPEYWGRPTFVKVDQSISDETINSCQIYLTTDRLYFEQGYTQSSSTTLAMAAERYKDDFSSLNIDLYVQKGVLKADLMYPSKYAEVKFYKTETVSACLVNLGDRESFMIRKAIELFRKSPDFSSTADLSSTEYTQLYNLYDTETANCESNLIGGEFQTNERLVEVKEQFVQELNYDYSENYRYNIVFTDLDDFGLKLIINKQTYEEEIYWIYSGVAADMQRTIDRTLRNWLSRNFVRLRSLGIIAELEYLGSYVSPFYNSIVLRSEYPNIPIEISRVEVGTTANYHIEHSRVLFNEIGGNLSFTINNKPYEIQTIYGTFLDNTGATVSSTSSTAFAKLADIPKTLTAWVEEHGPVLETYGIVATGINNLLKFDIKRTDRRLDYTISTGKLMLPGQTDYIITEKIKGNKGVIVTGNEAKLVNPNSSTSFEAAGFGTGRVVSINSTPHPLQDIKYNILSVDPKTMSFGYQGPFWGLESQPCKSSGFITLAFSIGFGQTTCDPTTSISTQGGGPFNAIQYNEDMFAPSYNLNTYESIDYSLLGQPGVSNLVDMKYIQLSNSVFVLGDNLIAMDAYTGGYMSTIYLTGNTDSIEMEFNTFNNYLYCLSKTKIWVVDPVLGTVATSISLTNTAADMLINADNGDIYITYEDSPTISIFDYANSLVANLSTPSGIDTRTGKMAYNEFEKDIYITTDAEILLRINGATRDIQESYAIPGLTQSSIFYEPAEESIYVYAQTQLWRIDNGTAQSIPGMTMSEFADIIYNNLTGEINVSDKTFRFRSLSLADNSINIDRIPGIYGRMALSQYDGGVYLASDTSTKVCVIDSANGTAIHTESTGAVNKRVIYNPEDKSIWMLQPSASNVFVMRSTVNSDVEIIAATGSTIEESQFGTLNPNYVKPPNVWIKAYECVRKPRENFEGEVAVKYYWKWIDDQNPEFFIYDLSGDQLEKTGPYAYTGPKPFKDVPLKREANRDVLKTNLPEYQQTVFDRVEFQLSYIDDQDDVSTEPTPLQLFLGFKAPEEGAYSSYLQLYKKEEVEFNITSTPTNETIVYFETLTDVYKRGRIRLNTMSEETFIGRGLKVGQYLGIAIKDITNTKNQHISNNSGYVVKIREIYNKTIIVDFFNMQLDFFQSESTVIQNYPKQGDSTYLKATFTVIDREIGRFKTIGQTEIEDPRFKIELGNVGKNIGPNEIFIFKEYDILEGGVDWNFLNMKRKELLMMKHLIYPYIGSYKSIINAINFFGYNDLQLNEYYRNIDTRSENFLKLFKVEIPDIFDNTVEGWTENDFMKHTFPNDNFEETNLFNLTYFITDKEGNNQLSYSLDDITIKLQGLKFWLKRNIIPLTHKILDITGRAYFTGGMQITHRVSDIRIVNIKENMTPVSFKLNEAYLMPVNSGSTVYNCVLDFYTIVEGMGADKNPTGLVAPPKPYFEFKDDLVLPEYFTVKIRTYKTYKEWAPFSSYMKGDKVSYYGKIYESAIDNNKIKSPRKHENVEEWSTNGNYTTTSLVKYERELFVYSGLGATYSNIPPVLDQGDDQNWLNITEWIEIDLEPVQTIDEYRRILPQSSAATYSTISMAENGPHKAPAIAPFNFAIDSNIDPFITIEVSSENGYGLVYRDRKNYEIRGLKDLVDSSGMRDIIGPFEPIETIY